ncbi:MAG: alanyl-tRNA editing protein [Paracoccaceae bacterium]
MTQPLFHADAYMRSCDAVVSEHTDEGGLILDQTIFYPTGGGQPGDSGVITFNGQQLGIASAIKGQGDQIILVPAEPRSLPAVGQPVRQELDWVRRYNLMRVHTALHLLSVALPFGVTGGSISADRGRLDLDMPDAVSDKEAVEKTLNDFVDQDLSVTEEWITEAELDANPQMVKTLSVQPPRGKGPIRLIRIGAGDATIDLQPCGGTHVARTGEVGPLKIGKMQKKGSRNRRVYLHIA